jgi:hypothetical protein
MFYIYRTQVWTGEIGMPCTIISARMLHNKYLCNGHFSESDFTTSERDYLNRVTVPYGSTTSVPI